MLVISGLGRQSKVNVWDLLASQPDLMGELKATERNLPKPRMVPKEWPTRLVSTVLIKHSHTETQTLGTEPMAFHKMSKYALGH